MARKRKKGSIDLHKEIQELRKLVKKLPPDRLEQLRDELDRKIRKEHPDNKQKPQQ